MQKHFWVSQIKNYVQINMISRSETSPLNNFGVLTMSRFFFENAEKYQGFSD
jgi:hypothetical protein